MELFGVDRSCLLFAAELVAVDCRLQRSWSWLIVDRSGVDLGEVGRSEAQSEAAVNL